MPGTKGHSGMNSIQNMHPITKDNYDVEKLKAASAKGNLAKKQRKTLKEIFQFYLTDEVQENIAQEFIGLLTNKDVRVSDKVKILEIILKTIGEYDASLTKGEFNDMKHIVLRIED